MHLCGVKRRGFFMGMLGGLDIGERVLGRPPQARRPCVRNRVLTNSMSDNLHCVRLRVSHKPLPPLTLHRLGTIMGCGGACFGTLVPVRVVGYGLC